MTSSYEFVDASNDLSVPGCRTDFAFLVITVKESVNLIDVVTVTPVVMTSQSLVRRGLANLLR